MAIRMLRKVGIIIMKAEGSRSAHCQIVRSVPLSHCGMVLVSDRRLRRRILELLSPTRSNGEAAGPETCVGGGREAMAMAMGIRILRKEGGSCSALCRIAEPRVSDCRRKLELLSPTCSSRGAAGGGRSGRMARALGRRLRACERSSIGGSF